MKRRFTFVAATLALLAIFIAPMGMMGQKTEGFETASASTTYNSTVNLTTQQSDCGIAWTIYYGCVSTNNKISGNKSAQMRWYSSATSNRPYIKSTTAIDGLTNVAFKAKVGNTNVKMDVQYSSDGTSWTDVATAVTFSNTSVAEFSYEIPSGGKFIKIGVSSSSTAPSSGNYAFIIDDVVFTYSTGGNSYTVTYHANVTGTADITETYSEGEDVTVADNTFTNPGYAFTEWTTEEDGSGDSYSPGDVIEDIDDDIDLYAQWEVSTSTTGTVNFGNGTGCVSVSNGDGSGNDDLGNTWTISTEGTTYSQNSSNFIQIGSSNNPATSITFTTTLPEEVYVTAMSAKFGGNSGSAGTVTMKVGDETVGTGTITASSDVVVNSSSEATGNVLTVTVTSISKGIKAYYISYTYETASNPAVATTTTISVPANFNNDLHNGTNAGTLSATVTAEGTPISGASVTWSSSNTGVATINASGVVTLVATGTTTITASYEGVEGQYRPSSATYELTVIDSYAPGTQNNPYTVAQAIANTPSSGNVYIHGIVSSFYNTSIVGDGTNYRYYISDDGTTTTQLLVYKGKGLNQATFTNANDLLVGDEVVIYGSLITYQNAPEVAANNYIVSLVRPDHNVATPTFSPAAGVYAETQIVTISCETEGATIYYTTDGTEPTSESNEFDQDLSINSTTTIKAIAVKGSDASTVATATYHIANSASNPYSVPEAQAFHEYPTPEIFVHGIVSTAPAQAPTSEGELTYYISYDGTTNGQLEVYKGKGLDEAAFTAQDDIQVGDIVTIYGSLQVYNSAIELGSGNYLVEFERPAAPAVPSVTVTPSTINAPAEGGDGTLTLTYENITEFDSFDYIFCDAEGEELQEDPAWIDAEIDVEDDTYTLYYLIDANDGDARTTYLKVFAFDDEGEEVYAIVTVNQAEYVVDYATLPFEYDGNGAGELPNGFTVSGVGTYNSSPAMKFDGAGDYAILKINERPGKLTFDVKGNPSSGSWAGTFKVQTSVDGVTYADLETYDDLTSTVQSEEFTNLGENVRYIKWIYTEKISGNVALGNITLAAYAAIPTITVNPATVNVDAISEEEDYFEGTLDLTWENLEISDFFEDFAIQYYDAEGEEVSEPDWIMADLATQDPSVGEGYLVSYVIEENESAESRTAYFKVLALGDEDYVYSNLVTITQAAYVAPPTPGNWVLTSIDDLTEDDVFVIVGTDIDDDVYALPHDGGTTTAPAATTVTIVEGTISGEPAEELQWNLGGNATDGYIFYPNGSSDQWLYCTATNNGVRVGTNENKAFSIDEDGYMVNNATSRVLSVYVNGGIPQDWRCYSNYSNNPVVISFYKKVETVVTETYTTEMLTGYGDGDGHYYLIASPVYVDPENTNMLTDDENDIHTYDLYYFDQGEDDEWRNYRQETFDLVPGQGYLYANKNDIQLTFTGVPYDGDGEIELVSVEGARFEGWNLIGNPFGVTAEISSDYFEMNSDGNEIIANEDYYVDAMQGVFVRYADANGSVIFDPAETGSIIDDYKKVVLNVTRNRGNVIDRAIVRFGEGRQLSKLQLNQNSTKVYFSQGNQDYAVVRSGNEGEMPVNFKAETRGSYTFTVETKNVEMNYLHLFDTKTGNDIDLLQTPSYTFEANVGDNANRFRLMFDANAIDEHNAETNFAYFNGSEWVISNMGEATLQVVDVMGRVLSSETINGNAELSISEVPGIYMFRLVNGNNVKVQKVVVR